MHDCLAVNVISCCHTQLSIEHDQLNIFVVYDQELMASERSGRPQREPAPEVPTNFMDTLQEMAYTMREQATTTHQIVEYMQVGMECDQAELDKKLGLNSFPLAERVFGSAFTLAKIDCDTQ